MIDAQAAEIDLYPRVVDSNGACRAFGGETRSAANGDACCRLYPSMAPRTGT